MKPKSYTCSDYRQEMLLIALRRRLQNENLTLSEKRTLQDQIRELEKEMGMD